MDDKSHSKKLTHSSYTVGWVCALPKELIAASAMLDETHPSLPRHRNDHNAYTLGRIGAHNVVMACLPKGEIGNNNSATVAARMVSTFPSIKFGLMVGIGGGVPKTVRLGDVVVSIPSDGFGGVVQWDFGKTEQGGTFKRIGSLNGPPTELLTVLANLEKEHEMKGSAIPQYLKELETNYPRLVPKYTRSEALKDILFKANYNHVAEGQVVKEEGCEVDGEDDEEDGEYEEDEDPGCAHCDTSKSVRRKPREMRVHYGLIASGNQVIKDAAFRDEINKQLGGKVLCFEMEAAGLMNDFPCIVIRGICDYADSHKNKAWQEHAAAVAAAFAKELLSYVQAQEVDLMPLIGTLTGLREVAEEHRDIAQKQLDIQEHITKQMLSREQAECHRLFRLTSNGKDTTYEWYKNRVEDRVDGTCEWFLNHENFKTWLKQDSGPLLVSADPGCGKSVLAKYLINSGLPRTATICYFFFKDQDQNTVRQALCALLHQLFIEKPHLITHAMEQFKKNGPGLIDSTRSLWTVLGSAVQDPQAGPITFVLDALDECAQSEFVDLVRNVEDQFRHNKSGRSKLKYLLTSRPYEQIVSEFQGMLNTFPYIRIPGEEESDSISLEVNHVILHKLKQLAEKKKLSENVSHRLESLFLGISHRTYLWVYLVFNYLMGEEFKKTSKGVDTIMELMPKTINEAYEQILNKSKDDPMVRKALSIILAASRPLSLSEMNMAMNIDDKSQTIEDVDLEEEEDFKLRLRSWCGLFVSIHHGKLYFLHQTAREFLLADQQLPETLQPGLNWHHSISIRHAHSALAEICVRYLYFFISYTNMEDNPNRKDNAFFDYSSTYWGVHFHVASITSAASIIPIVLQICDPQSSICRTWFDIYWKTKYGSTCEHFTSLMISSYFGHEAVLKLLLEKNANIEVTYSPYSRTLLLWAAHNGHEAVVKLLLENNANIEAKDSPYSRTPLLWAAHNGHEAVVKLLLENNASIETKDTPYSYSRTPLLWAAHNGHEAVVKLLLENNANIEAKDTPYSGTPLLWAAHNGHEAVVKLLLENNANIEAKNGDNGQTPLLWAAENGHVAVVKLLLENNANIEAKDTTYSRTPLLWAVHNGHEAVVKLLLEKNANIEAKDSDDGPTPLLWAIHNENEAVAKLLLENNANIMAKDKRNRTPLSRAIQYGREPMVKLLLEKAGLMST
ncbi:hypothetical protein V494_00367 [Pseudogymnoascus sp. VKM F-4513 (FW-928)]|nr:hypothetical protein V494_00367 [Pseudogymnoascus sp. VKM F-4513 (FW-928)]